MKSKGVSSIAVAESPFRLLWYPCCTTGSRRKWQTVIDSTSELLFARDVSFRCLNGCMAEQKLDLLQFTARNVAQARTRAAEIMWRQLRQAELRCVVFHNVPDHSVSHEIAPGLSSPTNTSK
jgi:hypothetical protein